jgi:class 3 adenylate cyclase
MNFTVLVPFILSRGQFLALKNDVSMMPVLFLAGIGDNWEVYLNGVLLYSEMHLDERGRIVSHRNYRDQYFPVLQTLFQEGENIIAFRIVGDPSMRYTGLFYSTPYYISTYDYVMRRQNESLLIAEISILLFIGLYHIFVFLRNHGDIYNLYYALFSMLMGIYYFFTSTTVYKIISDGGILKKIEFISLFMSLPAAVVFIETFFLGKIFLVTKIYTAIYFIFSIVTAVASLSFAADILRLWQTSVVILLPVILYCDIIFILKKAITDTRKKYADKDIHFLQLVIKSINETYTIALIVALFFFFLAASVDIYFSRYKNIHLTMSRFGSLLFVIVNAFMMAWRVTDMLKRQDRIIKRSNKCMNPKLVDCIVVADKDPESLPSTNVEQAIMFVDVRNFTRISEGMSSQATTEFLFSLNKGLSIPLIEYEGTGAVAYTDKFMGDGMMNVFEKPEISLRTAVDMRLRLNDYNKNIRSLFPDTPDDFKIEIGAGISYGPVTLGVMGHPHRLDFTPIGDTVNIASRLEALTKIYHTPILVNEAIYQSVNKQNFTLRHVDKIRVKGKNLPVDIYEEFSTNIPEIRDIKLKLLPHLVELQEMYFSGKNWKRAEKLALTLLRRYRKAALTGSPGGKIADHLPYIYLKRMRTISGNPKLFQNWDGVYTFK